MKVRWGYTLSSSFQVGNGVKQGGILSPVLFNIYMDKPSMALNNTYRNWWLYWWPAA